MSRHCILREFAINLSRLAHQGHTYIPTSHHRCCLHRQYEGIPWSHSQINIHVTKLREIVIATPWISRRRWPQLAYKMWESAVLHLVLLVILPFMFTWLN
ncbi:hypothetical protein VPH35_140268 [Triticum aestivum]